MNYRYNSKFTIRYEERVLTMEIMRNKFKLELDTIRYKEGETAISQTDFNL